MAFFAYRYYEAGSQVSIRHVIGDQNYDGIVEDNRETPDGVPYIEVTTTLKTYDDSLRTELWNRQGHVAAYGPVKAQGPRHNRIPIRAEGVAPNRDDAGAPIELCARLSPGMGTRLLRR